MSLVSWLFSKDHSSAKDGVNTRPSTVHRCLLGYGVGCTVIDAQCLEQKNVSNGFDWRWIVHMSAAHNLRFRFLFPFSSFLSAVLRCAIYLLPLSHFHSRVWYCSAELACTGATEKKATRAVRVDGSRGSLGLSRIKSLAFIRTHRWFSVSFCVFSEKLWPKSDLITK